LLFRPALALALVLLVGFAVGALASSDEAVAQATPAAAASPIGSSEAVELLERASRRLAETETVRFDLSVEGQTALDAEGNILLKAAEGELRRPDRVRATFQAQVLGQNVTLQLITIGAETWTTDLLTGEWQPAPEEFAYRPSVLFDNQEGIGPVMSSVGQAELLDEEEIDGREVYRVRAVVEESVIGPLTYETMVGSPVTVDLWLDQETDDLLRAELREPPSEAKPEPATWTLELFDHGEDVTIEAPV
jgi:hypothetical protein